MDEDDLGERGFCPTSCFFFGGAAGFALPAFAFSAVLIAPFFPADLTSDLDLAAPAFFLDASNSGLTGFFAGGAFEEIFSFERGFAAAGDFLLGARVFGVDSFTGFLAMDGLGAAGFFAAGAALAFVAFALACDPLLAEAAGFLFFSDAARADLAAGFDRRAACFAGFVFVAFKSDFPAVFVAIVHSLRQRAVDCLGASQLGRSGLSADRSGWLASTRRSKRRRPPTARSAAIRA